MAAAAATVAEVKATTTASKMALAALVEQTVRAADQTLAAVAVAELAGQAETAALTETAVATARQELLEILAATEITQTVLVDRAVLAALVAAQPGNTSVACLTSHSQTMAQCKEARPNAVHYP